MRKKQDYIPVSTDDVTGLFAQCLPQGLSWDGKGNADTVFYKLLRGLATAINEFSNKVFQLVDQQDIRTTEDLISEWEVAVGIPDECRSAAEDIATRRSDVQDKLRKTPIITVVDYQELAERITGEPAANWNIRPGYGDPDSFLFGSELVTNGDFAYWTGVWPDDDPDNWTVTPAVQLAISDGDANDAYVTESDAAGNEVNSGYCKFKSDGTYLEIYLDTLTIGKTYKISFTIGSVTSGSCVVRTSSSAGFLAEYDTPGNKSLVFIAKGSTLIIKRGIGVCEFTITDVSIKEITYDPLYRFVLLVSSPVISAGAFKYPFGSGDLTLVSLTSVGTLATATVSDTSTMVDGSIVTIAGAAPAEYNGDYAITITSGTTFDYTFAGSGTSPATGTITVTFGIDQTQIDALAVNTQYLSVPSVPFSGYPLAGSFRADVLACIFRKITPANVVIVFD